MHLERHTPPPARRKGFRLASIVAVGGALALSACGSTARQSPTAGVDSAVSSLGGASNLTVRVSLGITAAQAQQLASQGHSSLTTAEAQALGSGSISFTAQTGHGEPLDSNQAITDTGNAYDLALDIAGSTPVDIRYVSHALYLKAQFGQLLTDLGQAPADSAKLQNRLSQLNQYVPGISALGQGGWVEVSPASLSALGNLVEQAGGTGSPSATQIQSVLGQLRSTVFDSFKANSTSQSVGSTAGEYTTTVNVHGFLTSLAPTLQKDLQLVPVIGSKLSSDFSQLEKQVPTGKTITGTVHTSAGRLSEIDVDLRQFAQKAKVNFAVPLQVVFTSATAISTPANAQVLDLSKLPSLIQSMLTHSHSGAASTAGQPAS